MRVREKGSPLTSIKKREGITSDVITLPSFSISLPWRSTILLCSFHHTAILWDEREREVEMRERKQKRAKIERVMVIRATKGREERKYEKEGKFNCVQHTFFINSYAFSRECLS